VVVATTAAAIGRAIVILVAAAALLVVAAGIIADAFPVLAVLAAVPIPHELDARFEVCTASGSLDA
jgi:uncharacterized protein (DUF58 family)